MRHVFLVAAIAVMFSQPLLAQHIHQSRVDEQAPIGVMAAHIHGKGSTMFSLRGMWMDMDDPVNTMMGPQSMDMKMLMAGVMYAPSDKFTLSAMLNYSDTSMDMIMGDMTMGETRLKMGASDVGDLRLSVLVPLMQQHNRRFHVTLGTSVPLGSAGYANPLGARLALTMQPGTGSWGFMPSATYTQTMQAWSLGLQAKAEIWLDDNSYGERMGDSVEITGWTAFPLGKKFSISTRLSYRDQSAVSGSALPLLTDERRIFRGLAGASFQAGTHRFALEASLPIWQDRGRNSLASGFAVTFGWEKAF